MTTKSALCFTRLIPAFSRDALHDAERRDAPEDRAHTWPGGPHLRPPVCLSSGAGRQWGCSCLIPDSASASKGACGNRRCYSL